MQPHFPKKDKLFPRADAYVLMGYSSTQKGYLLYEMTNKRLFVSGNVIFKETMFLFKKTQNASDALFPNAIPSLDSEQVQTSINIEVLDEEHNANDPMDEPTVAYTVNDTTLPDNEIPDDELTDMPLNVKAEPIMPATRKSKRVVTTPAWHPDYDTTTKRRQTPYSLTNFIPYQRISPTNKTCLSRFSATYKPKSYEEALTDDR